MRGRKAALFFMIFWGLVVCIILSKKIEEEMVVQVQIVEPDYSGNTGENIYPTRILCMDALYEAVDGDEWDKSRKARRIDEYSYQVEESNVCVLDSSSHSIIINRSRDFTDGARIQKVKPIQGNEAFYLYVSQEEGVNLFLAKTKKPYMENLAKEELGLSENGHLYAIEDIYTMSHAIPYLGVILAALISVIILCFLNLILSGDFKKNPIIILTNCILICGITVFIHRVLTMFQLASSLLPPDNIFNYQYYRKEFSCIMQALGSLESGAGIPILAFISDRWSLFLIILCISFVLILFLIGIEVFIMKKKIVN